MNNPKRLTLIDRIRNSVKAFKGQPVGSLYFGVDVKRCDQCEYKNDRSIRDELLVTAGARAAYMEDQGIIELPDGVHGEHEVGVCVSRMLDIYLNRVYVGADVNFDEYIENALMDEYGPKRGE